MDEASLTPYPRYSWFGVTRTIRADEQPTAVCIRQTNHVIFYARSEWAHVRWVRRGHECLFDVPEHALHFAPADDDDHVRIPQVSRTHQYLMMLIPPRHIDHIVASEGCKAPRHLQPMLGHRDPLMKEWLERLVRGGHGEDSRDSLSMTEASRRLVLRLAELNGCRRPDWSRDAGVFDRRTMADLVEFIDDHLPGPLSLEALAAAAGLSPSHFARKFRVSTGSSLQRFVNRRRIHRSLALLKENAEPLASVSLRLGFSSQSHFTRLFSGLTGMTPARYRKQFKRTIG